MSNLRHLRKHRDTDAECGSSLIQMSTLVHLKFTEEMNSSYNFSNTDTRSAALAFCFPTNEMFITVSF